MSKIERRNPGHRALAAAAGISNFRSRGQLCSIRRMAWRVDEQVIRGEIDSRERGRVRGKIWFYGRENPVVLDLAGAPWRDLAGHVLHFTNPAPKPGDLAGLAKHQEGAAGDITATRKVKVPECTLDELMELQAAHQPYPWHWGNALYLEWFSRANGRVVVESADYALELDATATWEMTEAEEIAQREINAGTTLHFAENSAPDDDDEPQSDAERAADAENARMDLLLDRVTARLDREGHDFADFDRILSEERERVNRELGVPPEKEPTPEEQAAHEAWIEEMNAIAQEALADMETESWKDDEPDVPHPLVERARELAIRLHHQVADGGWLAEGAAHEHPLREVVGGVSSASAKLAGALGMSLGEREWPPDPLFAGDILVRLKKARNYLADARGGLDSADAENLADAPWRATTRREVDAISAEVADLIRDVRGILQDPD